MSRSVVVCTVLLAVVVATTPASARQDTPGWPREIELSSGKLVLYQPQPESFVGTTLKARAAVSYTRKGGAEPVFGALWLTARVDTDRDGRLVLIRDIYVTRIRWPNATPEAQERVSKIIEADFPKEGFHISLDLFTSTLETAEQEQKSLAGIKNDPPRIVFAETKTVLLLYDGEPRTQKIENSSYERVVNTPFAVVKDARTGHWYLSGGKFWYSSSAAKGPWIPEPTPPADLLSMVPRDTSSTPPPKVPPAVVVATEPTELIVSQSAPKWGSVAGGKILYVQNTETPWLREVASNRQYLLLSGRWFRSATTDGPWTFVRPDSLPAAFKEIPPGSAIGGVRASVAGTDEALDATLDLQIPQAAAIKRTATLTVEYQGDPQFKDVEGTGVAYAENTRTQVLRIDGVYYAVDDGVWFQSKAATGPWAVADSIPEEEIEKIPPSEPVYNTQYVHVYETTPEVVYVGYTPGYLWSFPYYGVPIYGTGWIYPPYFHGPWYYPHPVTYGMAVAYNPYYGWGVGMAWTAGFFTFGIMVGGGWGGYWGHPPYWGGGGGCYNCNIDIGNNWGENRPRPKQGDLGNRGQNNRYNRPGVSDRMANQGARGQAIRGDRPAQGVQNNVFTDRNGDVARRTNSGWQSRTGSGWKPSIGNTATNMNRDFGARSRGATRSMGGRGGGDRRR